MQHLKTFLAMKLPPPATSFDLVLELKDSKTIILDAAISLAEVRTDFWDGTGDLVLFYKSTAAAPDAAAAPAIAAAPAPDVAVAAK